jgi:hypothetical protein
MKYMYVLPYIVPHRIPSIMRALLEFGLRPALAIATTAFANTQSRFDQD